MNSHDILMIFESLLYAFVGILILVLVYLFMSKISHKNLWYEIAQNKNLAVAIVLGSVIIGISLIISTALHGG